VHEFTISEEDRQLVIMALAILSLRRPGWESACRAASMVFVDKRSPFASPDGAEAMFETFRDLNRDMESVENG
jgi:hypothetical protein